MNKGLLELPPYVKEGILSMAGSLAVLREFIAAIELHARKNTDYSGDTGDCYYNFREAARRQRCTVADVFEFYRNNKTLRLETLEPGMEPATGEKRLDTLRDAGIYCFIEAGFMQDFPEEYSNGRKISG